MPPPMKLVSTAPVLAAPDVEGSAKWYAEQLGFQVDLFPPEPPHSFAILSRDGVEVMLRQCTVPVRAKADWDVYIRIEGVAALHDHFRAQSASLAEPLRTKEYGMVEFAVDDPNGYRLVFSEDAPPGAVPTPEE